MATILTANTNTEVLIDDDDYYRVTAHTWWLTAKKYVYTTIDGKNVQLHRFITGEWDKKTEIDHVNGNRCDNRKENLRRTTRAQNALNKGAGKHNKSGYRGVFLNKRTERWTAEVSVGGERVNLGSYETAEDAAKARDLKAIEVHGEFARLNFPDFDYTNYVPRRIEVKRGRKPGKKAMPKGSPRPELGKGPTAPAPAATPERNDEFELLLQRYR
jgi:hypothetical protein